MTRPSKSALVLDGSEVKYRLQAERTASKTPVHVDWVRFTCLLRNAPTPSEDILFPRTMNIWIEREREVLKALAQLPNPDFFPAAQAMELAIEVAQALGDSFVVASEVRKGHDFYRCRWSIERNGVECGWVGFLASSESPRQQAQAATMHANIWGSACTFAAEGWNERIAYIVEQRNGDITRCDLALDFFDGVEGGFDAWVADYKSGACDSGGKRLTSTVAGDWLNGRSRSLYFGSKEAGKQTNCYEKGHQLFGADSGSNWLRIELRYGNKLRVLSSEMLRRPADFFAGASDWHALQLAKATALLAPEPVKTTGRLSGTTCSLQEFPMNKFARFVRPAAIGSSLVAIGSASHAAVPEVVTTALAALSTDALTVAGVVLAAIVAVYAFKFIRKGL